MSKPNPSVSDETNNTTMTELSVEEEVRRRLSDNCPYAFYFRDISYRFADGVLTLQGRLPTFHLKQVLQERLRDVNGVSRIDNQIDVVSSSGLSSVRPK